ncbi:RWD domain protein [Dirofilaria immitis]|nr:RWD domain protein [Dirofilaria immitis]
MDYKETQIQELEALEIIYPDELKVLCNEYPNVAMRISLQSHLEKEVPHMFEVTLDLQLPADYPDVAPEIEILGLESTFTSERIEKVQRILCDIAENNLGTPMIFTIVSALQDEIGHLVEDLETEKIKAEERAFKEKEAQERKKFEADCWYLFNVRCEFRRKNNNLCSPIEWPIFYILLTTGLNKMCTVCETEGARKLTGRQLFLHDSTLNLSDVALMQTASSEIEFDESLFDESLLAAVLQNTSKKNMHQQRCYY